MDRRKGPLMQLTCLVNTGVGGHGPPELLRMGLVVQPNGQAFLWL